MKEILKQLKYKLHIIKNYRKYQETTSEIMYKIRFTDKCRNINDTVKYLEKKKVKINYKVK